MATGRVDVNRLANRFTNLSTVLVKSADWKAKHKAKMDAAEANKFKDAEKAEQMAKDIAADKEFQGQFMKAQTFIGVWGWTSRTGCSKCGYRFNGSPCCNPERYRQRYRQKRNTQQR